MRELKAKDALYRSSIVVCGTHYSTTTIIGTILEQSPDFHMLYEPTSAQSAVRHDTTLPDNWYHYYDENQYSELKSKLMQFMFAEKFGSEMLSRVRNIRSPRNAFETMRYAQSNIGRRLHHKRAIFKDPFLSFSAHSMQKIDGMRVVVTMRHPCAFAESFRRRVKNFEFEDLLQPSLLDAIPEYADDIRTFAVAPKPPIEQAALLWSIVYGFALKYLVSNPKTLVVRQQELITDTSATISGLMDFADTTPPAEINDFIVSHFQSDMVDHASYRKSSLKRDASLTLNKWRTRLSIEDIGLIRARSEAVANQYGYGPDSW